MLVWGVILKKRKLKNGYYTIEKTIVEDNGIKIPYIYLKVYGNDSRFFRYRSINEHTIEDLRSNQISATSPVVFNDPYDCFLSFDRNAVLKKFEELGIVNLPIMNESEKDVIVNNLINDRKKLKYAICFSEIVNNTVMWSHYANQGKGFVVEYNYAQIEKIGELYTKATLERMIDYYGIRKTKQIEKAINNFIDVNVSFFPMNYVKIGFDMTEYLIREIELTKDLLLYSLQLNNVDFKKDKRTVFQLQNEIKRYLDPEYFQNIKMLNDTMATTKNSDWKYEREWRLMTFSFTHEPHSAIAKVKPLAVYLGERIEIENKKTICEICKQNNIDIYQMKSNYKSKKTNILEYYKLSEDEIISIISQ